MQMTWTNGASFDSHIDELIDSACDTIAPTWPLDRFIAVNPFHGWHGSAFLDTADKLRELSGTSLFMAPSYYQAAWEDGTVTAEDLGAAIAESGSAATWQQCMNKLELPPEQSAPRPMLSDILDAQRDLVHGPSWREAITQQISRFCAAWFDNGQSDWRVAASDRLYGDWRRMIRREHGIALLMHDGKALQRAARLPDEPRALIRWMLAALELRGERARDFLVAALLRINGWAAWCAYLRWQTRLAGKDDDLIVDLLAIRLAWELLLDDGGRGTTSPWQRWRTAWTTDQPRAPTRVWPTWQRALEFSYQRRLSQALVNHRTPDQSHEPRAQMVFCIDVRSEVIRRAIEKVDPGIATLGFAGFFGLPIAYRPLGTAYERPQLPGLVKPRYLVSESDADVVAHRRKATKIAKRLNFKSQTRPFFKLPASAFTLVETLGLGYAVKLLSGALPVNTSRLQRIVGIHRARGGRTLQFGFSGPDQPSPDTQAELLAGVLKAMSLQNNFARLVVLVGHGATTTNNAHAHGLDCGACGGQTGEVNVRLLARLLNDAGLREGLSARGITVPSDTRFVPALHNTTTDEITILDAGTDTDFHHDHLAALRRSLAMAGDLARRERAPRLGLDKLADRPARLIRALRKRGSDWSQTRPEWGLANNAAFIIAPRRRTLGLNLEGRVFLHEYDHRQDDDDAVLEQIMTAPMIVATWINLQYYASTVDNARYGCGNKVLHNVVGGRIGVFEGNGGDLRIGLPMQSLHNGTRWVHTPQRLCVFIEARKESIEQVMNKHRRVRDLVNNAWIFLLRIDPDTGAIERCSDRRWVEAARVV